MMVRRGVPVRVPKGKRMMVFMMTICIALLTVGIWLFFLDAQYTAILLWILISPTYIIPLGGGMFYIEFILRPKTIVIADPLHLTYSFRGSRDIALEDIEWVFTIPRDPSTLIGRMNARGNIKERGVKHTILLSYEIVHEIQVLYRERFGLDLLPRPPEGEGR
jgi:hypothetical protein